MNKLFHESGQLLKRNGSWAQKYIGDAVMAFWVHDDPRGTPKEMVVIFQSIAQLASLISGLSTEFGRPLAFGVGINSGLAVTGNMGSAGLADHTAMGDAVNKAFRLESATKDVGREILIGKSTFGLIEVPEAGRALFAKHSVSLKGYDQPEEAHALALADLPRLVTALEGVDTWPRK
jgi:adenylate cyclase